MKSGTLGAKVEVVVHIHRTLSAPTRSIAACIPSRSVPRASVPSMGLSSTTIGSRPAAPIALKQDFWSILDHTTYRPCGLIWRSARNTKVIVSPVAAGSTAHALTALIPAKRIASKARYLVSWTMRDEPAALGCSAMTSPLRPMPCVRPKCLRRTRSLMTRPSRSPTPTLPWKLFVSNDAISSSNSCMSSSFQPVSGSRRCVRRVVTCFEREFLAC
mmetsp:Transcript_32103/g.75028  ORF Transcript_32103/g.75028 Transcript_32103/m.75028 type:complete len:216 (+) Transcript_32103:860-1507(+)